MEPTTNPPTAPTPEVARRNLILGWSLLGIALLLAAGAAAVALIYLHFD
jgi:hypothetical protein